MNLGVGILEKVRVYELAKELNTTSKRLTEKLAEINIYVKNHMSLLSDDELKALYNHIGIISHDGAKKVDNDEKRLNPTSQVSSEIKDNKAKKDSKQAPRIIRKTEIIIDTQNEMKDDRKFNAPNTQNVRGNQRNDSRNQRQGIVRHENANSGLRAGYVRNTGMDYIKDIKPNVKDSLNKDNSKVLQPNKPEVKQELKVDAKVEVKQELDTVKPKVVESKPDLKPEAVTEPKAEIKAEPKAEIKIESKAEPVSEPKAEPVVDKAPEGKDQQKVETVADQKAEPEKADGSKETEVKTSSEVKIEKPVESVAANNAEKPNNAQTHSDRGHRNEQQSAGFQRRDGDNRRPDDNRNFNRSPRNDQRTENRQGMDRNQNQSRPYNNQRNDNQNRPRNDAQGQNRPPYNGQRNDAQGQNRPPYNGQRNDAQGQNRPPYNGPRNDNRNQNRPPYNGPRNDNRNDSGRGFGQSNRPYGSQAAHGQGGFSNRQGGRFNDRPQHLDIPKPDMTEVQKEELTSQRNEIKREHQNKDADKDNKREQRKDSANKNQSANRNQNQNQRFRPQKVNLSEKKGVSEVLSEDYILEEFYDDDGVKRTKKSVKPKKNNVEAKYIPPRAVLTSVKLGESITVKNLAETLKKTATEVIKKLMAFGVMATLNHEVDYDTAAIIAEEFGIKAEKEVVVNEEDILFDDSDEDEKNLKPRPPVVVVMGHVDHGKTSLLDAIRHASVIESEAGGITQHIGAYTVKINNRNITFLDTPGHEAFTAMRARGAQVTDIAILVVAADDGVMPQTVEAINHAKAANVSIIVAINKIDKPGANPERVKQELTEYGLVSEEWGGDVICVNVSAKKRENIDGLLEMVLLTADVLELKADPDRQAKGTVVEAKLDKDRGPIATILVQRGTLKHGDSIVTGTTVGRIRAMTDDKGHVIKKAGPSTPVEILGLPEVPEAGEIFYAITDEKVAKQLAEKRKFKQREQHLKASAKVSLDDLFNQIKEGKVKDLNLIVKADVQGSVEAVKQSLEKLSNDEVRVKIIHGGVGAIAEADVTLAQVSNAIIIGFNVRPGANVIEAAKNAGVDMRLYRIIYNAIEDIEAAMKGMLEPTFKEAIQGHAEIRQIFKVSGIGTIGGSYVTDGKIVRNSEVRIVRNGIVVFEGKLSSLKRFKDDAKEVAQGFECGVSFEKFNDIKEGDVLESYIMEEVKR